MILRKSNWLFVIALAAGCSFSASALAAPGITILGDDGTLRVTTYSPTTQIATAPLSLPYGLPPSPTMITSSPPVITVVPNTEWQINFSLSPQFFAMANSSGGGATSETDGKLTFTFTADLPFQATVTVNEDGVFSTGGDGVVLPSGGLIVTPNVDSPSEELGNSFPAPTLNGAMGPNTWQISDTLTGFQNSYSSYKISIDNNLFAEALAGNGGGNASITKRDFTIFISTNGSPGGAPPTPEPATLGVLAIGALALIRRRA